MQTIEPHSTSRSTFVLSGLFVRVGWDTIELDEGDPDHRHLDVGRGATAAGLRAWLRSNVQQGDPLTLEGTCANARHHGQPLLIEPRVKRAYANGKEWRS